MTTAFSITPAQPTDAATICRLAHQIWPGAYTFLPKGQVPYMLGLMYSEEAVQRQMRQEDQQYVLLHASEQPIGFASFTLSAGAGTAKLNKLYLLQAWQGNGLGKLMLEEITEKAVEAGCHTLFLNVNRYNPAFHFYKSAGFTVVREEDIPIGPYFMNDYLMQKSLK